MALKGWMEAVYISAPDLNARRANYEAVEVSPAWTSFLLIAGETLRTPNH
jgi:hypothetical protein